MKKNILFQTFFFLSALSNVAMAGSGLVAVYDGPGKLCAESGPEYPVLALTSDEAVNSMKEWLQELPPSNIQRATKSKSATELTPFPPSPEIAFSGYIKFCGAEERSRYFAALLDHLKIQQKNERAFVLILLHSRSNMLLGMIENALTEKNNTETLQVNLTKAKRLIDFQRRTPEPYPTESIVKRIEKKIAPDSLSPLSLSK
jgi:hypothetical protein